MLSFSEIIQAITPSRPVMINKSITEAVIDSRAATPNCLFVAIKGENVDGHDYLSAAFQNGAAAALIEHPVEAASQPFLTIDLRHPAATPIDFALIEATTMPVCFLVDNSVTALQRIAHFYRQKFTPRVIGVTGSVGKTTTKELIAQVLQQKYRTQKSEGNFNNEIGLPLSLLKLQPNTEELVLEMGFYVPGEIKLLCDIAKPHIGVFTLIGTVHAERAGSLEIIAQGKGELAEELPAAPQGVAILNLDDPFISKMGARTRARVFTYGTTPQADLWAEDIQGFGLDGVQCTLRYAGESHTVQVPLPGKHSVQTILRATAVALVEGLTWPQIIAGLQQKHEAIRLSPKKLANGTLIIDDSYNANPDSTVAALDLLSELPGRRIAILGDMLELGQYETEGHQKVGVKAAKVATLLLTMGKRAHLIAQAARDAGMAAENVFETENIDTLLAHTRSLIKGNEVILIKGSAGMGMKRVVTALEKEQ